MGIKVKVRTKFYNRCKNKDQDCLLHVPVAADSTNNGIILWLVPHSSMNLELHSHCHLHHQSSLLGNTLQAPLSLGNYAVLLLPLQRLQHCQDQQ